ncbi:MAG: hypothetical protein ACRD0H_04050, partial [Actinomycetes bacterium]
MAAPAALDLLAGPLRPEDPEGDGGAGRESPIFGLVDAVVGAVVGAGGVPDPVAVGAGSATDAGPSGG